MALHDRRRHILGVGRERRLGQPGRHAGADEPRLDQHHAQPGVAMAQVQALEVIRQPRLGRAIEHDRLAGAIAGDRSEHAQRAAAGREQADPHRLAELDRVREVGREHALARRRVGLERLLGAEGAGGDHHRVEAAQLPRRLVERRVVRLRPGQIQIGGRRRAGRRRRAPAPRGRRRSRPRSAASRPSSATRSPRAASRRATARPIPFVAADDRDALHAASPSSRTESALRIRPSGSQRRRIALKPSTRGSMAR